jgi:hypothetical protein
VLLADSVQGWVNQFEEYRRALTPAEAGAPSSTR